LKTTASVQTTPAVLCKVFVITTLTLQKITAKNSLLLRK